MFKSKMKSDYLNSAKTDFDDFGTKKSGCEIICNQ